MKSEFKIDNEDDEDNFQNDLQEKNINLKRRKVKSYIKSENNLIDFQQRSYIKEEVMISDMSNFAENEVSNDNSMSPRNNILSENLEKSNSQLLVEENIKTKHTSLLNECIKCGVKFKGRRNLLSHQRLCGLGPFLKCNFCDYRSKFRRNLKRHLVVIHKALKTEEIQKILDRTKKKHKMSGIKRESKSTFEDDLINFQQRSYIKEEVMISDMSNFSENDVSNDNNMLLTNDILSENLEKSNIQLLVEEHIKAEHSTVLNECTKCGGNFKDRRTLFIHQRLCELGPSLKCDFCDYRTKFIRNLKRHLVVIHNALKAEEIQKILYRTKKEHKMIGIKQKSKTSFDLRDYVKQYCSKCEVNFEIDNFHYRNCPQCSESALLQCLKCDKRFAKQRSIYTHVRCKCGPREYFHCADCDYRSAVKPNLHRHIERRHKTVAPEDYVKCRKCDHGFKHRFTLRKHERMCGKKADFQCEFCPFKSKLYVSFKKHARNHIQRVENVDVIVNADSTDRTSSKGVEIADCEEIDVVSISKTRNSVVLDKNVVLQCTKCGSRYKNKHSLQKHQKMCGFAPIFKCDFCEISIKFSKNLKRHMKNVHKNLNVEEIQKIFDRAKIEEHKMIGQEMKKEKQAPEDKVKCGKCGQRFKHRDYRHRHELLCGKEPHLQCRFCPFKSKYKESLRQHVQNHVIDMKMQRPMQTRLMDN